MGVVGRFVIIAAFYFVMPFGSQATYQCGIRKHSFVQLVHHGWTVEEGQWPWHVAIFHKQQNGTNMYACGGTLLDEKHVLTAAHCAVNLETRYALPPGSFKLHFGQQNLSSIKAHVQVRDVSKVHIHPEHSTHRNDIAILVLRLPVEYTDYVIPICIDQKADIDLRNLEGQRGWITGWGTTHTGSISDVLKTASLPVVSYLQCFSDDELVFGNLLNQNVFCAGDRNGTSPGTGDSGGGMYFSDGDRWVLRGIISFGKADESKKEVDTKKFVVFVNVQRFLSWIREIIAEKATQANEAPKRISEIECERYKGLARKRSNNICENSRYPHTVALLDSDGLKWCSGMLVNENFVLTAAHCKKYSPQPLTKVQIDVHGLVNIAETIYHPLHKRYQHDLAVIRLAEPVELSSYIIPACLANNRTENLYDTLLHTGYGKDVYGTKQFVESETNQILSDEACNELLDGLRTGNRTTYNVLCVIDYSGSPGIFGSSGGPLQSVNTRSCMYTVVGLQGARMSYSNDTIVYGIDMFTRTAYYLNWIEEVVWGADPKPNTPVTPFTIQVDKATTSQTTTTIENYSHQTDFVFPDN